MAKCDFCRKSYEDKRPNYGLEYGLVRLDNSGALFFEANICDDCRDKIVAGLKERMVTTD